MVVSSPGSSGRVFFREFRNSINQPCQLNRLTLSPGYNLALWPTYEVESHTYSLTQQARVQHDYNHAGRMTHEIAASCRRAVPSPHVGSRDSGQLGSSSLKCLGWKRKTKGKWAVWSWASEAESLSAGRAGSHAHATRQPAVSLRWAVVQA
jgi:hypothetical protein